MERKPCRKIKEDPFNPFCHKEDEKKQQREPVMIKTKQEPVVGVE